MEGLKDGLHQMPSDGHLLDFQQRVVMALLRCNLADVQSAKQQIALVC